MGLDLKKRVFECLQQSPEERFSTGKIATWIFENYEEACREKQKNSLTEIKNDTSLVQRIAKDISSSKDRIVKKYPDIKLNKIGTTLEFYYTENDDDKEAQQSEKVKRAGTKNKQPTSTNKKNTKNINDLSELDLYPILWDYLQSGYPTVYAKHINDKESEKNEGLNGHKWRHPDLVGVERSGQDWGDETRKCARVYSGDKPRLKLWSFEVKKEIKKSDSRGYFFQTVSNSSWANYGYLVAGTIHDSALNDLFILSSLHGIGLIRLNIDMPENSQIVIPAQERKEIDWNTADTLVKINPNFKKYIENIRLYYGSDNYWNSDYWEEQIILKKPKR